MLTSSYDLGDAYRLTYTLTDAAGTPTNATVVCTVTRPDGTADTPIVTNPVTGTYLAVGSCSAAGLWRFRFTATGVLTDAEDGTFQVEPVALPDLYATTAELRAELGDTTGTLNDRALERALRAASRAIDNHTGRRFWRDPTVTTRTYRPHCPYDADIEDIASTTGLVVKTDDGTGTWATTWTASDYQLEPLNAAVNGGAYSWTRLVTIGALYLPTYVSPAGRPTLQVTALHGWSQVPDPIREACIRMAVTLFKRHDAPFGVIGSPEWGPMRIARSDPNVVEMLDPYMPQAVA